MSDASSRVRPLISYYGGKQRMASKIVPLLPEHTVYVEPFAGGAAILFAKPWPNVQNSGHYREVLNDSCGDLVNLYRVARTRGEEFARIVELTPYSEAEYRRSAQILKRSGGMKPTSMDLAWAYYVNLNQSFASKKNGGWGRNVSTRNMPAVWNMRDVGAALGRLRGVYICHADAVTLIKQWDSPQTLFYCDPPYPQTAQGHYAGYTARDYARLIRGLSRCQGSFVLSQYDVEGVAIPDNWERFEFKSTCSAAGAVGVDRTKSAIVQGRERTEVVYRRFNTVPWREELETLRRAGKYSCFARREDFVTSPLPQRR